MTFTAAQIDLLAAPLQARHVKERKQAGRELSYLEGWHVIAEANRIFGFDGWNSETVDIRVVSERERKVGSASRDGWSVSYVAKVRITVGGIVREGVGAGHGIDVDLGNAHESAIKEAETDARKRALMMFGNQFGLALYDKTQANVSDEPPARAPTKVASMAAYKDPKATIMSKEPIASDSELVFEGCKLALDFCETEEALVAWGKANGRQSDKWPLMTKAHQDELLKQATTKLRAARQVKGAA